MRLVHFHTLRAGVQGNASPATGRTLAGFAEGWRDVLLEGGLFDTVEVEATEDPDQLVVALCHYPPNFSGERVAVTLEELWEQRGCFPFWEAHSLWVDGPHVELEAATRESATGCYVTVHMLALRSPVPAQRVPPG